MAKKEKNITFSLIKEEVRKFVGDLDDRRMVFALGDNILCRPEYIAKKMPGVSKDECYQILNRLDIRPLVFGGQHYFLKSALDEALAERGGPGGEGLFAPPPDIEPVGDVL